MNQVTKKKAIKILEIQKRKLDQPGTLANYQWLSQTHTLLTAMLPENSKLITIFSTYKPMFHTSPDSAGTINSMRNLMDSCIETIDFIGVYRKPQANITEKMTNKEILYWAFGVFATSFAIGATIGSWWLSIQPHR